MAEICSVYPSAGSVYHWAGCLAPAKTSALAAYITGWFNFLGNAAGDASFASGLAGLISSAKGYSTWTPDNGGGDVLDNGPVVGECAHAGHGRGGGGCGAIDEVA